MNNVSTISMIVMDTVSDASASRIAWDSGIPEPAVQRSNAKHYKSNTITEVKEFAGRSHLMPAQKGWEEVADFALAWAVEHATRRPQMAPARETFFEARP